MLQNENLLTKLGLDDHDDETRLGYSRERALKNLATLSRSVKVRCQLAAAMRRSDPGAGPQARSAPVEKDFRTSAAMAIELASEVVCLFLPSSGLSFRKRRKAFESRV